MPDKKLYRASSAESLLVGRKIVEIGRMDDETLEQFDWIDSPLVLRLDDGSKLLASSDPEGNGPGDLWFFNKDGEQIRLPGELRNG